MAKQRQGQVAIASKILQEEEDDDDDDNDDDDDIFRVYLAKQRQGQVAIASKILQEEERLVKRKQQQLTHLLAWLLLLAFKYPQSILECLRKLPDAR